MHIACPNVDCKVLLVAVNRCSMKVCFCPNMALLTVQNPLPLEASLIHEQQHCGKYASLYSGVQTNAQIGLEQGNCWGLEPAPSANRRDRAAAPVQHSKRWFTLTASPIAQVLAEGCSQNTAKCRHQIAVCELIVLALCCACSLQIYQFPLGDGPQKQTYDKLDTLFRKCSW
jgi:hypothetical protein